MVSTLEQRSQIQKIKRADVRLLWHADFWDGPINGLCVYNNKKCWFQASGSLDAVPRPFVVLELSPEQIAEEEQWHELFRQKVGTHCDYEEHEPMVRSPEARGEFYEAYKKRPKPDFSRNLVIGEFEM